MYPHIHFSIANHYFAMPTFALAAFVGSIFTLFYIYARSQKFQLEFGDLLKVIAVALVFGAIGSRALFLLTRLPNLASNFSSQNLINFLTHGGIVFYGGLLGVLLAIKVFAKYKKQNAETLFQIAAPAIPLFHGFARIGCLLGGCCFGRPLGQPFALTSTIYFERLPVPLLESIFNFVLFIILFVVEKRNSQVGLIKIYLVSYAVFRFIIEFLRGDLTRGIFWGLSTSQWISLAILVYLGIRYLLSNRTPPKKLEGCYNA